MSGSGKKRSSKWGLGDDSEFSPDDSKQLQSGWSCVDGSGSNCSKWSYSEGNDKLKPGMRFSYKEPFSGGRGSNKDDIMNKDSGVLDETMEWNEDVSYSQKMSPGLEEWKQKRRSQSPKNGWSRSSRSRSPPHGFRWDSGVNERTRMRAGGSTQPCRDFAAGKCRRGCRCRFLHDNHNHEDSWEINCREDGAPRYSAPYEGREYSHKSGRSNEACVNFAKGRCRMGASCKFVHHNNSDGHGKVSVEELTRKREINRRHRDSSFEQGGRHGPNCSGDSLCKFFANGNCHNGKYCKFSHDRQACKSPNRRLGDDRWASNPEGDQRRLDRPKFIDSVSPNRRSTDDRQGLDGNKADADNVWDRPKRNDNVVSDPAKLVEEKSENVGDAEPGLVPLPTRDGWGHSLDKGRVHDEEPLSSDKKEPDSWMAGNTSVNMHGSSSIGTKIWLDDTKMSPDWDYKMENSSCIEEKHEQNKHGIMQGGQGFTQNAESLNPLHSSSYQAVGQSQVAVPVLPSKGEIVDDMPNQEVFTEKKYTAEQYFIMDSELLQVSSRNPPPTENVVGKERLAQPSNLSASLVHILGTGQQLPQLYAVLNSQDAKDTSSSLAKTEMTAMLVSNTFVRPDPAVGLQKQYDPMCDSVEPKSAVANGMLPAMPPSKNVVGDVVEIPSQLSNTVRQNSGKFSKTAISTEIVKNDNGPLENMEQTDGTDEAKKTKDMKGSRAFKFALVEFVKELRKPTWKEGQITKEDYKTIVKKVVDKVTGSMQAANIPQTQEKIDHYLSFAKPKLNKLVQAYVEKVQKAFMVAGVCGKGSEGIGQ